VLTQTGIRTPCGYASQYTDPATGLQYLRARYYDPATQQFLTVDPLLAQTDQAYAYAGGSPTNATDPSGLTIHYDRDGAINLEQVLLTQATALSSTLHIFRFRDR